MFTEEAKKKTAEAVYAETEYAYDNYGEKYNSLHEGYAVLKEEIEEAGDEMEVLKSKLDLFWFGSVRSDEREESRIAIESIKKHQNNSHSKHARSQQSATKY